MPDTGAPWYIPYVETTDLVSDWPSDSLALANAIDAGLDSAVIAGIGSNVVQTVKTDTFSTTSATPVDITGLSVTITPTSATSKLLIHWSVSVNGGTGGNEIYLTDGSNNVLLQGDAAGTRTRATQGFERQGTSLQTVAYAGMYLWSPASTSAQTVKLRASGGAFHVNRQVTDTDDPTVPRVTSSITAIEVAA